MLLQPLVLLHVLAAAGAVLPEPKELVAGYRQNFAKFRTLEVQWRQTKEFTGEWVKTLERHVLILKELMRDPATSPERRKFLEEEVERTRMLLEPGANKPQWFYQDFWTDRERFQMRVAPDNWADRDEQKVEFPKEALTKDSLNGVYKDFYVLSYRPGSGFRVWTGRHTSEGFHGTGVHDKNPNAEGLHNFPPVGEVKKEWGSLWHPFDQFFARPLEEMRVTGEEDLAGRRTYILEATRESRTRGFLTEEEVKKYNGKLRHFVVTKAWIDPSQGYIPLRMVYYAYYVYDGKKLAPNPEGEPWLDQVRVEKVADGGYYPKSGVIYEYAIHPDHNAGYYPMKEREKQIRGEPYRVPPSAVLSETRWQAFAVNANAAMPEEMFALSFPDNSMYVDEREGKLKITGGDEKVNDKVIASEGPQPEAKAESRGTFVRWFAVAGVSFLVALAGMILYYGRRRTASN